MTVEEQVVFESGREGYHTYRIPALLVTHSGALLAFCEGRVHNRGDHGEIRLLLRRSDDAGRTWSKQQIVWQDGANTCGNPCPVQDSATGTIWLPANWNRPGRSSEDYFNAFDTRHVYVLCSDDDGRTWSGPRDITAEVKPPNWGWYAMGPCTGIELQRGRHKGRLLVPCNHSEFGQGEPRLYSHVVYSDDHGRSWHRGGRTPIDGFNECQAAELDDGRIILNARHYGGPEQCRAVTFSENGGATWSTPRYDRALIEHAPSGCQGSLIRGPRGSLLFSNPASAERERMTVRQSIDAGTTWSTVGVIHEGPAAYSCLAMLPDGRAACLHECGSAHPYERISLATFTLS